jgi:hypothetical protein
MHTDPFLRDVEAEFRRLRRAAERALEQLDERAFFAALDPESNSPAVLVKHLAGNTRSRWTDFLTTDGEKPDRNRDGEFVIGSADTRTALMERWNTAWDILFGALAPLEGADLDRVVSIRGEGCTVREATIRQLTHTSSHVGQIILLAKHHAGAEWKTLSIPRGQSEEYSRAVRQGSERRP